MSELSININNLLTECADQPEKFFEASTISIVKNNVLKRMKAELDIEIAKLSREIRLNPEAFGLAKPTEASVDAAIKTHPNIIKLTMEVIGAEEDAAKARALSEAWGMRSSMLRAEVELANATYATYTNPRCDMAQAAAELEVTAARQRNRRPRNAETTEG